MTEHTDRIAASARAETDSTRSLGLMGAHPNAAAARSAAVVFPFPDSDEAINRAVAKFQESLADWRYRSIPLTPVVRGVRDWSRELWDRLVSNEKNGEAINQPPILFRFQWESPRILGHYQPGRNDAGFKWEVSINPRHLLVRSEIEVASTVLHELLHLYEDLAGTAPRSHNGYHSSWFRRRADELGIPCTRHGSDMGVRDPSPFVEWARERGLKGVPSVAIAVEDLPPTRVSKRVPWECACDPDVRVSVHVARASDLRARCERCGELFERGETRRV